jgi:predicted N-acyltransferase
MAPVTAPDASVPHDPASYELVPCASIRDVGEAEYRALVGPATPPFLRFEWLDALERTGCAVAERGWLPQFLALYRSHEGARRLVAVAPAYLKWHSDGEFVFDHSWADFAERRLGLDYYPKLILAVPFTPATGPKLLVRDGEDAIAAHRALAAGVERLLAHVPLSSAHVLFPPEEEAERFGSLGWARRFGIQFHWQNPGYSSYEDFLNRFTAKRRAALRREERDLLASGVALEVRTGKDLDEEAVDAAYTFYLSTVDKYVWGRRYLNRDFFFRVAETMPEHLHLVLARDRASGRLIGGAFNLLGRDTLYGRYWGASEERPFLHFNVCFYAGIRECITRGLTRFEPGAGGEHKHARGFEATITHSAHTILDPTLDAAVRDFLDRERRAVVHSVERAREIAAMRPFERG